MAFESQLFASGLAHSSASVVNKGSKLLPICNFPVAFSSVSSIRARALPFIRKWVLLARSLSSKSNSYPYERLFNRSHFETEANSNSEMVCSVAIQGIWVEPKRQLKFYRYSFCHLLHSLVDSGRCKILQCWYIVLWDHTRLSQDLHIRQYLQLYAEWQN